MKSSSKLGKVETDDEKRSITCPREQSTHAQKEGWEQDHQWHKNAPEMHKKHIEPDGEHDANSYFG